jgi:hypothetical protein
MERPVLKPEHQSAGHPITMSDLNQITVGKGVALQRAQHEKAVDQSFQVAHDHRRRRQRN